MALQKATHSIPIVFASIPDPVGNRVVASLAHPGGNITGSSLMSADLSAKRVELLKQLRPSLTSVAVLTNPDNPVHSSIVKITQNAARSLAIRVSPIEARSAGEIERGLSTLSREKATGLIVLDDAVFNGYASLIARLALSCQVPSMYANPDLVEFGGLAGYGASGFDAYRRAAALVDKILRGANPRELPVEQPTKFYLVLNKKTAGSLAVSFPPELVLLADRVIE
jgi:putative ABC transport system substrate-binding protein